MEIEYIRSTDRFLSEEERWNELVENGVSNHSYLRHEWFRAWWEAFGIGKELCVVVICEGGRWMGVAPLCAGRTKMGPFRVRSLAFMFHEIGPRCELILREGAARLVDAMVRGIKEAPCNWSVCRLDCISEDSATYGLLGAAVDAAGLRLETGARKVSPFLAIRGTWDGYLRGLSSSRRREIRRAWRQVKGLGETVRFRRLTDYQEITSYLPQLFEVSARSWKGEEGVDMGATAAARTFYRQLCDGLARAGRLVVWTLEVDGKCIAMMYCLREGNRVIEMRSDFAEEHRRAGPGNALMGRVLKECFESGIEEHDFGGAAYGYKLKLADDGRRLFTFDIYAGRPVLRLLRAARMLRRRLRARRRGSEPEDKGSESEERGRRTLLRRVSFGGWRRVREAVYKSYRLRLYHLAADAMSPLPERGRDSGIEYRELPLEDWALLEAALIASGESDPLRVRRRLAAGDRVFCGLRGGRVIHFSHVCASMRALPDVPIHLELLPDDRFVYKCYTLPEARRQGIFVGMLRHIAAVLVGEGIRNAYIDVANGNVPSTKAIERSGFTLLHTFCSRRVLGFMFPVRRRVIQIGRLHASARPVTDDGRA